MKLLRKNIFSMVAFFALTQAAYSMPVQSGTILYNKTIGNWLLAVTRLDDTVLFRAAAFAENEPQTMLMISFSANDCDYYFNELIVSSSTANDNDIVSNKQIAIAARIDSEPILNGSIIKALGNLGEHDIRLSLNFGDSSGRFISQVLTGNKLRLKLGFSEPIFLRFNLYGSNESLKLAKQWCDKFSNDRNADNDKNFFDDSSQDIKPEAPRKLPEGDSLYFREL